MKIIIIGCGKVGRALAEQLLLENHALTVIDTKAEIVNALTNELDVMGIEGNGASNAVLTEAGIQLADLMIAVTSSDELNLLCCLVAHKTSACKTIARVRNPVYHKEIGFIKEELGLSLVINPEAATALEISRLLKFPDAIDIDLFARGRVELLKLIIPETSVLDGLTLYEMQQKLKTKVLVCAVERGDAVIIPSGGFQLKAGDAITFVSPAARVSEFFKQIGIHSNQTRTVIIVGGGMIAYYLANLLQYSGIKVTIIEQNKERCEELSVLLPDTMVICGDGTDPQLLEEEGVTRVDAVCSLTNMDEENIMLSLYIGSVAKAKRITKVNRDNFREIIQTLNIGSIVQSKSVTAETILRYVRALQNSVGSNVETLCKIVGGKAEALEFRVRKGDALTDIPLKELRLKENLLIGCITRQSKVIVPSGQDTFQAGDTVIVVTTNSGLQDLKDIIREDVS